MFGIKAKNKIVVNWSNAINYWDYNSDYYELAYEDVTQRPYLSKVENTDGAISIRKNILEKGKKYRISFTLQSNKNGELNQGQLYFNIGGNDSESFDTAGSHTFVSEATNNSLFEIKSTSQQHNYGISNLEIEDIGYTPLDIYEDEDILLNLSISDVRDYTSKSGSYTKKIKLPSTAKNNKFFDNLFEINTDGKYNYNQKTDAVIEYNAIEYFTGYIKLENIIKLDKNVEYEIVFYSQSVNLFESIGEDTFNELDLSDINHTLSYDNVVSSWSYPDGGNNKYVYPYIDYGEGSLKGCVGTAIDDSPSVGLTVSDLYPAISVKYIIDKIFDKYGFEYDSDLFDSIYFRRMILPFVQNEEVLYDWHKVSDVDYYMDYPTPVNYHFLTKYGQEDVTDDVENFGKYGVGDNIGVNQDGIPNYISSSLSVWEIDNYLTSNLELYRRMNYGPIMTSNGTPPVPLVGYADQSNPNNYQTHKNHIPGTYLVRRSGKYKIKCEFQVTNIEGGSGLEMPSFYLFGTKISSYGIETVGNGAYRVMGDTAEEVKQVGFPVQPGSTTGWQTREIELECDEGDMIAFKYKLLNINDISARFRNFQVYEYGYGDGVDINGNNILPKNYKIKDFLSDIITMFNLYVDVDKYNDKLLIIEPREDYYNSGSALDWSNKLDLSSEISQIHPNYYQNTINKLQYTQDDEYTTSLYNEKLDLQNVGFGGKKFVIESDFADGEKITTLNFAATPLRDSNKKGYSGDAQFVYSRMWDADYPSEPLVVNKKLTWKPRIIMYNYTVIGDNDYPIEEEKTSFRLNYNVIHNGNQYLYPYAGHILFPFNMDYEYNFDLNFDTKLSTDGVWQKLFTGDDGITKLNLYNRYYHSQIQEYTDKDARVMTANFNLDLNDIINLKLNDIIQINNTNFKINNIQDYSPKGDKLTKVELLKTIDNVTEYVEFNPEDENDNIIHKPINDNISSIVLGDYNRINRDSTSLAIGNNNIIGTNSIIIGSNNTGGDDSVGINTNNSHFMKNTTLINTDNIEMSDDVTNATVINTTRKKLTNKDSDSVFINDTKFKSGIITSDGGVVDGGIIEIDGVYNTFKRKDYIINDCGENGNQLDDKNAWKIKDGGQL